ncbi:MAG: hypothetical protein HC857_04315 [Synechococcales cyanobacterium RU_4_20]|nr:hypothetical protein [Synechococcales cyanobacterium RU_4_20]
MDRLSDRPHLRIRAKNCAILTPPYPVNPTNPVTANQKIDPRATFMAFWGGMRLSLESCDRIPVPLRCSPPTTSEPACLTTTVTV